MPTNIVNGFTVGSGDAIYLADITDVSDSHVDL
jgi:hypothetical protein